jgi:hypothetical protein
LDRRSLEKGAMVEHFRRFGAALVIAGLLLTSRPSAANSGEVPAIAGVRPGMTADSVLRVLKAQHIAAETSFKPCLSDYLALHKSIVGMNGPGHCPDSVDASFAEGTLIVFLTEDVPRRPGVSIVTRVALNSPSDGMMNNIIHNAGPPTLTDGRNPWTLAMWCFGFVCHDMNRVLATNPPGQTLFVHRGIGLTLSDDPSYHLRNAYINRVLTSHGVRLTP